jgi:CRP-like cAMP-binding protein
LRAYLPGKHAAVLDSGLWSAFTVGVVSALSLPIGAATTRFWRPADRVVGMLMAFGGGALLAALTIDLVASALERGHFNTLAVGALLGGLLFVALNQAVNARGGFLRKASTTFYHLRGVEHERIRDVVSRIREADLFSELSPRDFKAIAPSVRSQDFPAGSVIHRAGDPADALYIVAAGEVELHEPQAGSPPVTRVERHGVFALYSTLTGAPVSSTAIAATDVSLWAIPKSAIDALLLNSAPFTQCAHRVLRSDAILGYLMQAQGMDQAAARAWLDRAAQMLLASGRIPAAVTVQRNRAAFLERITRIRRFPLVHGLPPEEQELVADCLIHRRHRRGETLFHQGEPATRLYFIDYGRVSLVDSLAHHQELLVVREDDAFGGMAVLTGGRHTMTAVAIEDMAAWELRRKDLDALLAKAPGLAHRFQDFVRDGEAASYLTARQRFDADRADRWCRAALRCLEARQPLPTAAAMAQEHKENAGAPLAIFLGITLDGIPESLVIGASMADASISLSLIVGLFLSNYPEALSSAAGMRRQGMPFCRVMLMWGALVLITGAGAAAGSLFFSGAGPHAFALIQGLAAGAMLTMIAETMLPEAYLKGGSVVGLSTLIGFLVAIYSKTLEPGPVAHGAHGYSAPPVSGLLAGGQPDRPLRADGGHPVLVQQEVVGGHVAAGQHPHHPAVVEHGEVAVSIREHQAQALHQGPA